MKVNDKKNSTSNKNLKDDASTMNFFDFLLKSKKLLKRYRKYIIQAECKGVLYSSIDFDPQEYIWRSLSANEHELFVLYKKTEAKIIAMERSISTAVLLSDKELNRIAKEIEQDLNEQTR